MADSATEIEASLLTLKDINPDEQLGNDHVLRRAEGPDLPVIPKAGIIVTGLGQGRCSLTRGSHHSTGVKVTQTYGDIHQNTNCYHLCGRNFRVFAIIT
jgi:hypothetical protein